MDKTIIAKITDRLVAGRKLSEEDHRKEAFKIISDIFSERQSDHDAITSEINVILRKFQPTEDASAAKWLYTKEVEALVGVSSTTIFGWADRGKFPMSSSVKSPVTGNLARAWREDAILEWLEKPESQKLLSSAKEHAERVAVKKDIKQFDKKKNQVWAYLEEHCAEMTIQEILKLRPSDLSKNFDLKDIGKSTISYALAEFKGARKKAAAEEADAALREVMTEENGST